MNALIAINFQIVGHSEGWNSESDAGRTNLTCLAQGMTRQNINVRLPWALFK